ncbi:MAG: iron chelate uptake ABC transporter family permease subunit [Armatimonadota bacterium]|nr:iron chelate uptake ABC transporter family permease subunit [Armatimonadota bacterium]
MVNPSTKDINEAALKLPSVLRRLVAASLLLTALLIAVSLVSLGLGQSDAPLSATLKSAAVKLHLASPDAYELDEATESILWDIRLPRILLAALVGMLLAAGGVALQGLLLNPLADPYTVGVSSGAALGASIAVVLGWGGMLHGFGVPALAFATAIAAMLLVYSLARYRGRLAMHSFLLAGIVVGSFLWALLTFVMTIAGQDLSVIIYWLLGSFSAPDPWGYVRIAAPFVLLALVGLYAFARDLNVLSLGEETANHLGVRTESLKNVIIIITSLATAAAVSVSGVIGFVGLIVPHMARRVFGPDHRILLPAAALLGATLMVAADTAARNIVPGSELPVGVITALLGAPFFCYLLKRGRS